MTVRDTNRQQGGSTRAQRQHASGRTSLGSFVLPVLALVAILFIALPLAAILIEGARSLVNTGLREEGWRALRLSAMVSLSAVALSAVFGFPLAWWMSTRPPRLRAALRVIVILPMVMPPVVAGLALLHVFSRNGWLGGLGIDAAFTIWGAILAASFVSAPFFIITAEAGLDARDRRLEQAAATLGASTPRIIRTIVIPAIWPSLLAGLALTWARALGEFGATITFNGSIPGRTQTIPLAVYDLYQSGLQGPSLALSALLIVSSAAVLLLVRARSPRR